MREELTDMMGHPSALDGFTQAYTGNPPWDIGRPQPPFIAIADQIASPVLDAGCGTGGTSVYFAGLGHQVTGIDFVEEAIRRARARAWEQSVSVDFVVKDAMTLGEWEARFASVIDSGLFHIYRGEERERYVQGLAHVLQPGGKLFLFCFSSEEPVTAELGISRQELCDAFADGWEVESLEMAWGEVSAAFMAESPDVFPGGRGQMWFAVIRRVEGARS